MQARPQDNPGIWQMIRNILEKTNNLYETNQNAKQTLNKAQITDRKKNTGLNDYIENREEIKDSKIRFTSSLKINLLMAIKNLEYDAAEAAKLAVSWKRT